MKAIDETVQAYLRAGAEKMGLPLTQKQILQFALYSDLLVQWNEKMNLTAITEEREIVEKHFLDSLAGGVALRRDGLEGAMLIDIGTGAGFPGIPLKILFPGIKLTLLDSLQKRIHFLHETCRRLDLTDVTCIHGRAEELGHSEDLRESFDAAVSRAVAPLPVLLEYCAGFVRQGGIFLAYKGPGIAEELAASGPALSKLRFYAGETMDVAIPDAEYHHFITIFEKIGSLPLKYPRKQSKIKKESL